MKPLIVTVLALTLGGCASNQILRPQPKLDQLSTPEAVERVTAVNLSAECLRFSKQVPHPNVLGQKPKVAWKITDYALSTANAHLSQTAACIKQQRDAYAHGLPRK